MSNNTQVHWSLTAMSAVAVTSKKGFIRVSCSTI